MHRRLINLICQSTILEFEAEVSRNLAIEGCIRCEKVAKFLIEDVTIRCVIPVIAATFTLIFVKSILQHGRDFEEYLYIPYAFR